MKTSFDVPIGQSRALEILTALADYHGILREGMQPQLETLTRSTEQGVINAFYKEFPKCQCPTNGILLCIIEELHRSVRR